MSGFRWLKTTLFMMLLHQVTASVPGQRIISFTTRAGDKATLPCYNVIENQVKCNQTTWLSSPYNGKAVEELINLGQIVKSEMARAKSNRLSVTADCSLAINNVTHQDVGRYSCRQYNKTGQEQGGDTRVFLSVINVTQEQHEDMTVLDCAVFTYECEHTVQWLFDESNDDVEVRPGTCSAKVTFPTYHLHQKSEFYESLKCKVTDKRSRETLLYDVGKQSLLEKTGITERGNIKQGLTPPLWVFIVVALGLAALFAAIIIMAVVRRKTRTKVNKTQKDANTGLTLATAVTSHPADPEDAVAYASVSYTATSSRAGQVKGDDDTVTYSTVSPSSSPPPAAASADHSDLYATVNKPRK